MGGALSAMMAEARERADEEARKAQMEIREMMACLENKRDEFLLRVEKMRGASGYASTTEVAGGRTVMRSSQISVKTSAGVDPNIKAALGSFFKAASGAGDPKAAAIEGAQTAVNAGLDALFGCSQGSSMEKQGFIVLFLNYAFVRVDYLVHTYCATGKSWGASKSKSGSCMVTDLSVLKMESLEPCEMDFLLAQALTVPKITASLDAQLAEVNKPVYLSSLADREYLKIMAQQPNSELCIDDTWSDKQKDEWRVRDRIRRSRAQEAAQNIVGQHAAAISASRDKLLADPANQQTKGASDMALISNMKLLLAQSVVLSRMLKDPNLDFRKIRAVAVELTETQAVLQGEYNKMKDFCPPPAYPIDPITGKQALDVNGNPIKEYGIYQDCGPEGKKVGDRTFDPDP